MFSRRFSKLTFMVDMDAALDGLKNARKMALERLGQLNV